MNKSVKSVRSVSYSSCLLTGNIPLNLSEGWAVGRRVGRRLPDRPHRPLRAALPHKVLFPVLLTTAILLKSGVKRKFHAPFGRGSGVGDYPTDLNLYCPFLIRGTVELIHVKVNCFLLNCSTGMKHTLLLLWH
jgi:hypothetical protein